MKRKPQTKSTSSGKSEITVKESSKNLRQLLEKLREAERRYRTVSDFTYDWEYWESPEGTLLYISPSCQRIAGYKPEEFIEKPSLLQEIIVPEDNDVWHSHHFDINEKVGLREVQFRIRRKDGQIRWIEHACRPVVDEQGRFFGFRASNRDITERKQMEETLKISKAHLNRAQEVAHLGSWYLDLTKDELLWSDEIYRIFGVPPGSAMTYERFLEIVHPDDREYVDKCWMAALNKEPYDIEHRIIVHGKVKWVREKAEVEFNQEGRAIRGIGIVQDITEHRQAEEASRQLQEELKHVARVTTMGELTAALAHELNQPLMAIMSNAQAAQRFLARKNPDLDEIKEILSDIIKDDKRASEVIGKLRALLKKSDLDFKILNINDVIRDVISLVHSDMVVSGDRIQLQQVILNLILNSFEAMADVGSKRLSIRTAQENEEAITVSVEDNGTGIDEKSMDRLFKPFFTTKREGMGMGLAINKAIVEAHGGSLRAGNNPGQGARLYFTLPVGKEH